MQTQAQTTVSSPPLHASPSVKPDASAEDYVAATLKMRQQEDPKNFANGGLLRFSRWVGDAALAVVPKNRFFCSLGLTAGGGLGLYAGKLLAGKHLADYTPIAKEKFPKFLRSLHGLFEFNENSSAPKDRWNKLGALYTFTAISAIGIAVGAKYAYKSFYKSNENPDSLEDYVARIGQDQGDKWRWLAATSGVLGSASGMFALPYLPGANYGSSVAFYTVLNQDRKVMTPGLRSATGTKTTSYLGLREGLEYLGKYAEYNPSKNPAELEYLALTILGPLADASGTKLTASHIQKFVNKLHEVRDKYWQQGGIPADKREDMKLDFDDVFKGKGLDKTLYDCGFDTMKIDFLKMNGLIGKLGNKLGAKDKVLKEQAGYRAMATEWRKDWQQQASPERSPSFEPEKTIAQKPSFTQSIKPRIPFPDMHPPLSHQDRVLLDAANANKSVVRAD